MHKIQRIGVVFLAAFVLVMDVKPFQALATITSERDEVPDRYQGLNIGIPDFPRRLRRELPEVSKTEKIDVGPLKLHPAYTQTVEFDDNIHLSDIDEDADVIFTETPALTAEVEVGDHRFEGGYGMEIVNFVKDEEENAINHLAHLMGEFNFKDLQITVEDSFEKSTSRLFSETSARDELIINSVDVMARYDRPHWAAETGWTHNTIDHRTPEFNNNDYNEDILALLGGYKILPKTLLLAELDLGTVYYDNNASNADQDYWQILGGIRGDLTSDITVTMKGGFQNRELGDVPGQGPQTDFDGMVADADVVYRLTDSDIFRGGYVRTVKTSTFQNNSWYRQDKIYVSYRKRFLQKWYLTPQTSWQLNDYPEGSTIGTVTKKRDDHFWQAGASLRYKIREWLWTGVSYNFRLRNSDFDVLDYDSNRVVFDVSMAY